MGSNYEEMTRACHPAVVRSPPPTDPATPTWSVLAHSATGMNYKTARHVQTMLRHQSAALTLDTYADLSLMILNLCRQLLIKLDRPL